MQNWEGKSLLNWKSVRETKYGVSQLCAKGFLNWNFNEAVTDKISILPILPQISHIHENHIFKSIIEFMIIYTNLFKSN